MPTTSNFGWTTPADTDLVKDGASAIRTLANGIDTSLVDLKGGTTGQVLSKNTNTDLDFTWVTQNDSDAIQNSIVDAKGDLISATGDNTPARLAVGTDGQILSADSTTATGLKWIGASNGYTLIASGTLGSSGSNLTSIPGTYQELRLRVRNFRSSTDSAFLQCRLNNDSTANRYHEDLVGSNGISTDNPFDGTGWRASANNDNAVSNGLIEIRFPDYANTTTWKYGFSDSLMTSATTTTRYSYVSLMLNYNQTGAITEINLYPSAGSIGAGTYELYGVK